MSDYRIVYKDELYHYGIKGMRWGVRRYQNPDGSLTLKGQRRYGETHNRTLKSGTEVQNISRHQLDTSNKKSNRIYSLKGEIQNGDKFWFQTKTCLECFHQ